MVRISKLSDYAVQLLAALARSPERALNARDLSAAAGIAEPTVRKLLKALSRAQLLISRRGVLGGYRLARPPEKISVAEILEAIEGPVALTECNVPGGKLCERQSHCGMRKTWQSVNRVIYGALDHLTLSQMAQARPNVSIDTSGGSP